VGGQSWVEVSRCTNAGHHVCAVAGRAVIVTAGATDSDALTKRPLTDTLRKMAASATVVEIATESGAVKDVQNHLPKNGRVPLNGDAHPKMTLGDPLGALAPMLCSSSGGAVTGALRASDFDSALSLGGMAEAIPSTAALPVAAANSANASPFTWDDVELPPKRPDAGRMQSRIKRMPAMLIDLGGRWPLEDPIELAGCHVCDCRIRLNGYCEHVEKCEPEPIAHAAAEFFEIGPEGLKARGRKKPRRELKLDAMCGVPCFDRGGAPCMRSLSCKTHPVKHKRMVAGRSRPFDDLLAEHEIAMGRGPNGAAGAAPKARAANGANSAKGTVARIAPFVVSRDVGPLEHARRQRSEDLTRALSATAPRRPSFGLIEIPLSPVPAESAMATAANGGGRRRKSRRRKAERISDLSGGVPQPVATCSYGGSVRTASGAVCWSASDLLFHSVLQRFEASVDDARAAVGDNGDDLEVIQNIDPPPAFIMTPGRGKDSVELCLPPVGAASTAGDNLPTSDGGMGMTGGFIEDNRTPQLFRDVVGAGYSMYGGWVEFPNSRGAFEDHLSPPPPPQEQQQQQPPRVAEAAVACTPPQGTPAAGRVPAMQSPTAPVGWIGEAGTIIVPPEASAPAPTSASTVERPPKRPRRHSRSAAVKPPAPANVAVSMPSSGSMAPGSMPMATEHPQQIAGSHGYHKGPHGPSNGIISTDASGAQHYRGAVQPVGGMARAVAAATAAGYPYGSGVTSPVRHHPAAVSHKT